MMVIIKNLFSLCQSYYIPLLPLSSEIAFRLAIPMPIIKSFATSRGVISITFMTLALFNKFVMDMNIANTTVATSVPTIDNGFT